MKIVRFMDEVEKFSKPDNGDQHQSDLVFLYRQSSVEHNGKIYPRKYRLTIEIEQTSRLPLLERIKRAFKAMYRELTK